MTDKVNWSNVRQEILKLTGSGITSGAVVSVALVTDAPDVGGGGTVATVGLGIVDADSAPVAGQLVLQFAVFDDEFLTAPASNATLDNATKGTILDGAAGAALMILTDANGEFECSLFDTADETVWIGCASGFGSPAISCEEKDSVTFSL